MRSYSPLATQWSSSANLTTANGCVLPCSWSSLRMLSRRSGAASYSRAWSWKASAFISASRDPRGQQNQVVQHGPVDRVPGQNVAELVPDHRPELLGVEQVDQTRVEHDEGVVGAERHRVHQGSLRDEQLRYLVHVQDVGAVAQHLVDMRELPVGDLYSAGEEIKPHGPFVEQAVQQLKQGVEAGELTQRHQRRTVGGMLVCAGRDAGEPDSGAIWN